MKKLVLCFVFAFFVFPAQAIIWSPANQITLGWDAVTTLADGSALPAGSSINYKVFTAKAADKSDAVEVGIVAITRAVVTFQIEGRYYLGVQAQRVVGGEVVSVSIIAWSDDAKYTAAGQTFGVQYFLAPAPAGGLRLIE